MYIRKIHKHQGYLTVEAAIFLPVFLLSMISLILVIRLIGLQDNVMKAYAEEAQNVALNAYMISAKIEDGNPEALIAIEWSQGRICELAVKKKIFEETEVIEDVKLEKFKYLYKEDEITDLISGTLLYSVYFPLPPGYERTVALEERLLFRGFVGCDPDGEPLGYEVMEQESNNSPVFVFPRAGEKYHAKECRIIVVYPEEMIYTYRMEKKLSSCRLCRPENLPYGSLVYYFASTGEAFHKKSCALVDRYVISLPLATAVSQGYTPCLLCKESIMKGENE